MTFQAGDKVFQSLEGQMEIVGIIFIILTSDITWGEETCPKFVLAEILFNLQTKNDAQGSQSSTS